jgi:1-deoxy-D-xylulose 5-phosphate reductoisomerase
MNFNYFSHTLYSHWQRAQDAMEVSGICNSPWDDRQEYYVEAFLDGELEWTEYVYGEEELQTFKDDAIKHGLTFTVRIVDTE